MTVQPRSAVAAPPEPSGGHRPESAVPTVGVEEEFFLLWPDGRTADVAPEVLGTVGSGVRAGARGDSSHSRTSSSTGLGLAIVRAVVTGHGGTVAVPSVPGRTAFTVRLPQATVVEPDTDVEVDAWDPEPSGSVPRGEELSAR